MRKNYWWFSINEYPSTEFILWIWNGECKLNPQQKEGWLWLSCELGKHEINETLD